MIKTGAVLAALAGTAYFAFPGAREFVLASLPVLLALICPLSMIGMMFMMKGSGSQCESKTDPAAARPEEVRPSPAPALTRANADAS